VERLERISRDRDRPAHERPDARRRRPAPPPPEEPGGEDDDGHPHLDVRV
jgi:hypothetical protein